VRTGILVLVSSLVFTALVLELSLRAFLPRTGWTKRDNALGWSSHEYQQFDPQRPEEAGAVRILFLGDSFLAGSGVSSLSHRFPVVLRQLLGGGHSIAILASGGWGTDQQLLAYEEKGTAWKPDLTILAFCANNDISNILSHHHGSTMLKPYFTFSEQAGLELHTCSGLRLTDMDSSTREQIRADAPWKRSMLLRFIALVAARVRNRLGDGRYDPAAFPAVDPRYKQFSFWEQRQDEICAERDTLTWAPQLTVSHASAYIQGDFPLNSYPWQLFEQLVVRLAREVEGDGGRLVVMLLPVIYDPGDLDTIAGGPFVREFHTPAGPFTFRSAEPRDRLEAICARHGLTLFDPTDEFRARIEEGGLHRQVWPSSSDRHFSELGHKLLAELLEAWLDGVLTERTALSDDR
jgi:lysophospholipase L1-like esterase